MAIKVHLKIICTDSRYRYNFSAFYFTDLFFYRRKAKKGTILFMDKKLKKMKTEADKNEGEYLQLLEY